MNLFIWFKELNRRNEIKREQEELNIIAAQDLREQRAYAHYDKLLKEFQLKDCPFTVQFFASVQKSCENCAHFKKGGVAEWDRWHGSGKEYLVHRPKCRLWGAD